MEVPVSTDAVSSKPRQLKLWIGIVCIVLLSLVIAATLQSSFKQPAIISEMGKSRTLEYQVAGLTLTTRTVNAPNNDVEGDFKKLLATYKVPLMAGLTFPTNSYAGVMRCSYPKDRWRYDADLKTTATSTDVETYYLKALPHSVLDVSAPHAVVWRAPDGSLVRIFSQGLALTPVKGDLRISITHFPGEPLVFAPAPAPPKGTKP